MAGKRKPIEYFINENGCWICTSHHVGTHGYPCIYKDGRTQNLHRVIYEEKFGSIADLLVRHKCDNRGCINIDHLEPGSKADNTNDATVRNRHNPPYGERSGTSKLTQIEVRKILGESGPQYEIAAKYGVNQSTISRIKSRKRWAKGI